MNIIRKLFHITTTYNLEPRNFLKGFTIIELLVTLAIVAVLGSIGMSVFNGAQLKARDSKRKADVDAIAKVYESKYDFGKGKYQAITATDFYDKNFPAEPRTQDYYYGIGEDGKSFIVCSLLENQTEQYCRYSSNGPRLPTPALALGDRPTAYPGVITSTPLPPAATRTPGPSRTPTPTQTPTPTPTIAPIAHWKFDEGAGTAVTDSVGSNNGTWAGTGTHWVFGEFGYAGSFNGVDDYINLGTGLNVTDFTISAWVKKASAGQAYPPIFVKSNSANNYWAYGLVLDEADHIRVLVNPNDDNTSGGSVTSTTAHTDTTIFHHIVGVKSGNTVTIYYDGSPETTTGAISSTVAQTTGIAKIGGSYDLRLFAGLIDEVKIYNYALTDQQIQAEYVAGLVQGVRAERDNGEYGSTGAEFVNDFIKLVVFWKERLFGGK